MLVSNEQSEIMETHDRRRPEGIWHIEKCPTIILRKLGEYPKRLNIYMILKFASCYQKVIICFIASFVCIFCRPLRQIF